MQNSANDMSHGIYDEPKVQSTSAKKQVALAALKHIDGAKEIIEKHFNRGPLKIPYSFPTKPQMNLKMHHTLFPGAPSYM